MYAAFQGFQMFPTADVVVGTVGGEGEGEGLGAMNTPPLTLTLTPTPLLLALALVLLLPPPLLLPPLLTSVEIDKEVASTPAPANSLLLLNPLE
jgi:hypothetical protein